MLPVWGMSPFSKILVPTDFSDSARVALERALDLRQQFGASLTLLHVYQIPISYPNGYVFTADVLGSIEEAARGQMGRELEWAERRAKALSTDAELVRVETRLLIGAPSLAIVEEAERGGHDLIVMGTHGHTGLKHLFIGSVAERVVRTAPCPVLTIR